MRYFVLAVSMIAFSTAFGVERASLLDFELKSLEQPEVHSLAIYEGKPIVIMFFQPECNWCAKQVRAINDLLGECRFEAIAIGVGASRLGLRRELRRLRPDFPAYQASPELIEQLGGVPATPITLLGNAGGEFVGWSRGYLPDEKLRELMAGSAGTTC